MDKERFEYIERAGIENMRERIENATALQREAHNTLLLLLAGAGAALGFVATGPRPVSALTVAAFVVSLYLFLVAGHLVARCMMVEAFPAGFNEPRHLNRPDLSLDDIRQIELANLDARIAQAAAILKRRSGALNLTRLLAIATPLVGGFAWWLAARFLA